MTRPWTQALMADSTRPQPQPSVNICQLRTVYLMLSLAFSLSPFFLSLSSLCFSFSSFLSFYRPFLSIFISLSFFLTLSVSLIFVSLFCLSLSPIVILYTKSNHRVFSNHGLLLLLFLIGPNECQVGTLGHWHKSQPIRNSSCSNTFCTRGGAAVAVRFLCCSLVAL